MENIKYTIVGIAPIPVQKLLQGVRGKFSLTLGKTSEPNNYVLKDTAHFAIKRSFYIKKGFSEIDIINKIKEISFKKIDIICSTAGIFTNSKYGNILFAKIDDYNDLLGLHDKVTIFLDKLTETINPEMEREKYIPHISLAYNLSSDNFNPIKKYIDDSILPIKFNLDKIVLLKDFDLEKDERKTVYEHFLA